MNKKILIVRVSAIGDVIHTLPALFYIRKMIPSAKISWIVQEKAASLLQKQPFIENLYVLPNDFLKSKNWGKTASVIRQLRSNSWDAIINFQGLFKTSFLIAWQKGLKFGFDKQNSRETISTLFTHHQTSPTYTNIIQKNLALASDVIQKLMPDVHSCPSIGELQKSFELRIPEEKKRVVNKWLNEHGLQNFIANAPNTTWPSKHWPLGHWKKFIDICPHKIVLIGESFGDQAKELAQSCNKLHVAPKWDLLTIAYLIKKTDLLIAPDTGILHLADFLQTKTIGLFGPTLATKHGPFLTPDNVRNAVQIECPHRYKKSHKGDNCMARFSAEDIKHPALDARKY